jgi:hypothetical protein
MAWQLLVDDWPRLRLNATGQGLSWLAGENALPKIRIAYYGACFQTQGYTFLTD